MFKVVEDNLKFEFIFEDSEEATDWRDYLRDCGFSANIDPKRKQNWVVVVEKESIRYAFFMEFVILRSPDKYINRCIDVPMGACMHMLKRVYKTLDADYSEADVDKLVEDVEYLLELNDD